MKLDTTGVLMTCGSCGATNRLRFTNFWQEIAKVATNLAGKALVLKVDTEANPELAARFRIQSIPTLAVWKAGQEAARTAGAMPAERIEAFVRGAVG